MYKTYNEVLVEEIKLYIINNESRFKYRMKTYSEHMKDKIIRDIYDKEKAMKGFKKHTEQGIGLYLIQFPTSIIKSNTFSLEDKQEIAERLESFYCEQLIENLNNN